MAGGLIQIASYGIHDVFLIGNPQITFFRTVYKKHTNFSMEYIEESLNGTQNFGNYLSCNLSKSGDLINRLYLKIVLPKIAIEKAIYSDIIENNQTNYDELYFKYNIIQNFFNIVNYNIIQQLKIMLNISNLTYTEIKTRYNLLKTKMNYNYEINKLNDIIINFDRTFKLLLNNQINNDIHDNTIIIDYNTTIKHYVDFDNYFNIYIVDVPDVVNDLNNLLNNFTSQINILKQHIYEMLLLNEKINKKNTRSNINFAWVDFLGNQIINKVEIMIGGKVIDFTDAVKLNINYQLTNKIMHDTTYSKLIGNIQELTTFNDNIKPSYIMYIPFDFWFNKYTGLSLPLIYLRFHDVKVNIWLNDTANCCYYEKLKDKFVIEDLVHLESVSLICNYVYLDTEERSKFAQMSQEYLINQTQILKIPNINTIKQDVELTFFHPIKQLFWVVRDYENIIRLKYFDYSTSNYIDIYEFINDTDEYSHGLYKANTRRMVKVRTVDKKISEYLNIGDQINILNSLYYCGTYTIININNEDVYIEFDNFVQENYKYNYNTDYTKTSSYTPNSQAFVQKINNNNPIKLSSLNLQGVSLFNKIDGLYTNMVQAYQHNSKSPNYGLNSYSFAINPEDYQPSGTCNFNRIDLKTMTFIFDDTYINNSNGKKIELAIYTHNYNVLKFAYGKAGLVLNI